MNNEYYTPTIEEFHIGFEYEYSDLDHNLKNTKWFKEKVPLEFSSSYYLELINKKDWIRVKYLDKEDVESLGFINWAVEWTNPARYYFTKALPNGQESIKKGIQLFFIFGSYDRDHVTIYNTIDKIDHVLFDGVVKNKSELKQLLKQLNI
jgi:hypothetical protein